DTFEPRDVRAVDGREWRVSLVVQVAAVRRPACRGRGGRPSARKAALASPRRLRPAGRREQRGCSGERRNHERSHRGISYDAALFQGRGLYRLILIVLGVAVALGTGEAVLRVVRPQSTVARMLQNEPAMFRPSDVLPYELRPGYVGRLKRGEYDVGIRIDGQGYRSPEFSPGAKKPVRILTVGDSFTFGWGVEGEAADPQ